jgi:hypothetical protein
VLAVFCFIYAAWKKNSMVVDSMKMDAGEQFSLSGFGLAAQ